MKLIGIKPLDLQAKIVVLLTAVLVPIFLFVTLAQNQLTGPILLEEMKQSGLSAAQNLLTQIQTARLLPTDDFEKTGERLDRTIQSLIYYQPQIVRMDVWVRTDLLGRPRLIASNVDDNPSTAELDREIPSRTVVERGDEEQNADFWMIYLPIFPRVAIVKAPIAPKPYGVIRVLVSLQSVENLLDAIWKITVVAGIFTVLLLIAVLSFFLRRTIENDRKLKRAQDQNLILSSQLHEAQRSLMTTEKLAVMGQLTASFAHEIGTPLNAVGGHLQLLRDEVDELVKPRSRERLDIISGELDRIATIVKDFLQSTAKPVSQRQLVDLNPMIDKTFEIIRPRAEVLGVELKKNLDRSLGPVRVVPIEIEQILLNLFNNALDSLKSKKRTLLGSVMELKVDSRLKVLDGSEFIEVQVMDTGVGISKSDLEQVFRPFFTTKAQGEGTGLGLTICRQLIEQVNGRIQIDSREGAWTRVRILIPYSIEG